MKEQGKQKGEEGREGKRRERERRSRENEGIKKREDIYAQGCLY